MFIIVNSGMADDGETFVDILNGKVYTTHQEAKDEFHKFIVDCYFYGEDIPKDHIRDEEGLFVDFTQCIYMESSDSYTHIEMKSIKK